MRPVDAELASGWDWEPGTIGDGRRPWRSSGTRAAGGVGLEARPSRPRGVGVAVTWIREPGPRGNEERSAAPPPARDRVASRSGGRD
ncbi:hypothetical protein E2562_009470 [Oryza meyeriana var. granulata]|uniref:DUF834 domain-containing protein n=1 Tax=Oryza meyeriana var. granulata TaxID=110450 RepID=A0A6G1BUF6_9ORYZ|nr:hypothetical protein E2562_009470 [Oryza meyeriana var. granulata]